jgi:hypothetical protein
MLSAAPDRMIRGRRRFRSWMPRPAASWFRAASSASPPMNGADILPKRAVFLECRSYLQGRGARSGHASIVRAFPFEGHRTSFGVASLIRYIPGEASLCKLELCNLHMCRLRVCMMCNSLRWLRRGNVCMRNDSLGLLPKYPFVKNIKWSSHRKNSFFRKITLPRAKAFPAAADKSRKLQLFLQGVHHGL